MKRKIISLAAIAVLALSTAGLITYANNSPRAVKTAISEMGIGLTFYDPPETVPLSENPLTYQYTAKIPANKNVIGMQQSSVNRISYHYADQSENELIYDTKGRIKGYTNLSLDPSYSVSSLSENACIQAAQALAESLQIDLSGFSQLEYAESETGATVKYSKNPDTIYCSTVSFEFVPNGLLLGFTAFYTDVDLLSDADYTWFISEAENYISNSDYANWPSTVESESCYRVGNTLCYQMTVTFFDEEGNKYPEIVFVSKAVE